MAEVYSISCPMESTVMHVTEVDDANHYGVSNNTALVRLDPNSMLKNVQVRFEEAFQEAKRRVRCSSGDSSGIQFLGGGSSIYTWTGSVLLAINPYQQMNVYDVEYVRYHYSKNLNQADPHPFAIASHAYRQLSKTRVSQSIIISGESGAGKTESSKHVMRFLTMLDETFIKSGPNSNRSRGQGAGGRSTLDDRILGTNPILEAFGNAKTVRNDNSSRFGKLMKLNYTLPTASHNAAKPVIKSASIDTYLLARSRVTHTSSAYERSYHIFYLLCAGVKDVEMRKRLRLEDTAGEYTYLTPCKSKGPAKVRDMDDAVAFAEVVEAFTKLGIPESEQMAIFSVVSAVMKLGNIGLYPDEGNPEGKTRTDDGGRKAAEDVAALIGLDELPEPFIDHLTRQRLVVGGNKDITWADIRSTKASTVRDALAKSLYVKVFDYVVDLLNEKLRGDDQSSCVDDGENVNPNPQSPRAAEERSICILDIFGFENLARNSLEQLCINFANERLNEYFTENVVLSEREEYHQEHIPLPDLTPPDNRPTINVIASLSPPGIFEHLRVVTVDYMIRPLDKDYDAIFMSRLAPVAAINWCKDGSGRGKTRVLKCVGPQHPQLFIVNHYAEPVTYSTEGFIEKNKDCDKNVMDLLSLSNSDFIQKLISGPSKGMEADSDGEGWKGAEYGTGGRMSIQPASRMSVFGGGRPTARSMSIAGHSRMSVAQCFGGGGGVGPTAASKKCIASEFAKQVDVLLEDLKATRSHYIRCIKPNDDQLPGAFRPERVFKQLEVTGMFTVLVLMAHAYPTRIPYADLFDRYKSMLPGHILGLLMRSGRGGGARLFVEQMLDVVAQEEHSAGRVYSKGKEFALGTSKVFFRPQSVEPVDSLLAAIDCDVAKRNRVAQAIAASIIRRRRYRQQCYIRTGGRLLIILRRRQNYWKWFHQYFLRLTAIVKYIRIRLLPSVYERRRVRKAAACRIQSYWRARQGRKRQEAALIIIARVRCYLAQKLLKEKALRRQVCMSSAICIQCAWRQRMARKEIRRRFNANEEAKRRRAEIERMKELQREKEVAEKQLEEARRFIERKEEESAAACEALLRQKEQKACDRENRSMELADWEAHQIRDAQRIREREEAEKAEFMRERASLEATLAEQRARFEAEMAAEKARVEAQMAEEKALLERRLADQRAEIEAERARNEEEKRRIEEERAEEAKMAEVLRQRQVELEREKIELEQAKLTASMAAVLSSPGYSECSSSKRENELLAAKEEEIMRLRAEVEAFRSKKEAEDEGCSSSKRAHSPALESVPPAKRSRSNSSNDIEKNTPQRAGRGDVPMMAASPLAFTPGRPDRSESRLESAQKARRAARADYTGGDSSAVNRREQMQRRERMQSSAEKEKRLKAMRESARWFEDDNGTSLSPIKRVDEEEDDDRCGDRKSLLDISDKEMYDAKPQTKWETDPSQIVVGESQMIVQRVWNRESRRLRSSEVSIPSMVYSESNLRQPSASLNKGRGARARAASANTSAVSGSGAPNATRIPARAVRTTRAAAAVYERENISGLSAAAASTLNISYGGGGGKGRATRMQPPGVTVKSVARGSAADRARSAPITGVRRAVPKAGPAGGVASQPAGSQSKIGRGNGTLRTAAAAVTSTSLLSNNSCRGRGVASKRP